MEVISRGLLAAFVVVVIMHEVAAVGSVLNGAMARVNGALTGHGPMVTATVKP